MSTASTSLKKAMRALKQDLLAAEGPAISTMRNYRFAILVYDPKEEYPLRSEIRRLSNELQGSAWNVLHISLQRLLLERIKNVEPRVLESILSTEKRLYERSPQRALTHLKDKVATLIEGENGIAADVVRLIGEFADTQPDDVDRTLILIGRAGALYPFYRSSALLKHIDGKTRNLPVVLLYPGERPDPTASGLSFMGELPADRDYRPRIYS